MTNTEVFERLAAALRRLHDCVLHDDVLAELYLITTVIDGLYIQAVCSELQAEVAKLDRPTIPNTNLVVIPGGKSGDPNDR